MKVKEQLKKTVISVCSTALLIGIGMVGAQAVTVEVGDFTVDRSYSYGSYTTKIKAYNGAGGDIVLPESADFSGTVYPITEVGNAFKDNELITGVTIPEGYTDIGTEAFSGCTALKKAEIPGSVTLISTSAFSGCTALDEVIFDEDTASSLTVNMGAFADCTSLASIELPARLSNTRYNFLYGCDALTTVKIKDGAQDFAVFDNILYNVGGESAVIVVYPGGKTETEYTVPAEIGGKPVTSTAMHLFRGNTVLEKVTVPATVTNLGGFTFNGMKAIEEIVLEHETAPTLGSDVCTEMKAGSKIIVKNDNVAAAFESTSKWTVYYTAENTTVVVGSSAEEKTVSATVSIAAEPELRNGNAVYGIYLDSAENLNTVLIKVSFDAAQVEDGELVSSNAAFASMASDWTEENGKLVLKAYLGMTGNVAGFTSEEKSKLAEISVPLKDGVKGNIAAEITDIKAAGVVSEEGSAMNGTVTVSVSSASVFVPSYDVNGDGKVDIIDITEAQRYYQAKSSDENWAQAKVMDVNGDGKVDIQDYIDIFNHLSDF